MQLRCPRSSPTKQYPDFPLVFPFCVTLSESSGCGKSIGCDPVFMVSARARAASCFAVPPPDEGTILGSSAAVAGGWIPFPVTWSSMTFTPDFAAPDTMSMPVRVPSDVVDTNCLLTLAKMLDPKSVTGRINSRMSSVISPISLNTLNPANPKRNTISMKRTMYPANDVDVSEEESSEASEASEALLSSALDSENQDATLEAGAEAEAVEAEEEEEEEDVDDVEGVNTLNIELDAEAGGLDFAKDAI